MSLVILPRQLVVDINGTPRNGARASFYDAGTTDPRPAYPTAADAAARTNPLTQPVVSSSTGLFSAIYINTQDGPYKIIVQNEAVIPVTLYTEDNIAAEPGLTSVNIATSLNSLKRTAAEIAAGVTPADYSYMPRPWLDVKREGCVLDGTTDDYGALSVCVSVAGSTNTTFVIDGPLRIATNITIPANVVLLFVGAGQLVPDVSRTVTVNGVIQAHPNYQIFAGSGSVVLSKVTNAEIWANWFKGSDIGAKINNAYAAITPGPAIIRIAPAQYSYSTQINLINSQSVHLTGPGSNLSTLNNPLPNLIWTGGASSGSALKAPGAIGLEISRLTFTYTNAAYDGNLISLSSTGGASDTSTPHIHHCSITGTDPGGGGVAQLAASLIELNQTARVTINNNSFRYGVTAIKANGAATSNVIAIRDNYFQSNFSSAKILAQGNAWSIESNVFEDSTNLIAALDMAGNLQALRFCGNQCVDGGAGGGTLVDLHSHIAYGVEISGNSFSAASGTAVLLSSNSGESSGINIHGNLVDAMSVGFNLAAGDNISIVGNRANVTTPWTGTGPTRLSIGANDFGATATSGVSVANAGVIPLSRTAVKGSGVIHVYSVEDNKQAIFMLNGAGNSVDEVIDPANLFTAAAGGASSINIYWSAGNTRYELENLRGATRKVIVNSFFGR